MTNSLISYLGYRKYTQYLTKRNILLLAGILFLLFLIVVILAWISGSEDPADYYAPTLGPPPAASRAGVKQLETNWKLMGAFTEHECAIRNQTRKISCHFRQRLSFDEESDSLILSKYFPEDHLLKSEKLQVDKDHKQYV